MSRRTKLSGPFIPLPRWVLPYVVKDETTLAVAIYLLQYMDAQTQGLTASHGYIAEQMQRSRRSVIRSVNKLEEIGFLIRTHRSRGGRSVSNQYYVNFNNPETVTSLSPSTEGKTVTRVSLGGDTGVTTSGDTGVTQTRENKRNKKKTSGGGVLVDRRLLNDNR